MSRSLAPSEVLVESALAMDSAEEFLASLLGEPEEQPREATAGHSAEVRHGDVLEVLRDFEDNTFDGMFCDPPYGLAVEAWDDPGRQRAYKARTVDGYGHKGKMRGYGRGGTPQDRENYRRRSNAAFHAWVMGWGGEALRVVKPGAWLMAYGSPRTAHRLAAGLEDAGWEMRDVIIWEHSSGVPKSRTTELRPVYEPVILARRPLTESTVPKNVTRWGVGDLRVGSEKHAENVVRCAKPSREERKQSGHPTPKPVVLGEMLSRLILPASGGGKLLVPFAGSGSEMIGACRAGWGSILGIEREAEYVEIARRRLAGL